ncbi:MAG: tRNA (adenosine(37)-N6)-threonylcarbamoyltransferase complex transferase subunit TsaD [Clostridia bacterium]
MNKDLTVLGIETSCDETSASVVVNGRKVLSCVIESQINIHRIFGGVVPEVASRNHVEAIDRVVKLALKEANLTLQDIDLIGVTYGAGLVGALLVGVSYAKSLSQASNIPLIAVNHIEGHCCANYITHSELTPPFISLMVSGGHTAISLVEDYLTYTTLSSTVDDAIGEAFDKVARLLGLPYPGGPEIDRLAKLGSNVLPFPSILLSNFNFSYSGIKTAVANYINNSLSRGLEPSSQDICASFTFNAIDGLITAVTHFAKLYNLNKIAFSGGVSANSYLRSRAQELAKQGYLIYLPELKYCTDNGAMIASRAYFQYVAGGQTAELTLNAEPTLKLRGEISKKIQRNKISK